MPPTKTEPNPPVPANEAATVDKSDLIGQLAQLVARVPLQLHPEIWRDLHKADLTVTQAGALSLLMVGPQRVSAIARNLGISQSATTNLLDRLEQRKLIRRKPDRRDRRAVICHVTKAGERKIARVSNSLTRRITALTDEFSDEQLQTVVLALKALSDIPSE